MYLVEATLAAVGVLLGPAVVVCGLLWVHDHVRSRVARFAVGIAVLAAFAGLYAVPAGLVLLPS